MVRLGCALLAGTVARLLALWAALAAVAWAARPEAGLAASARWLGLAAPLALVWSHARWRQAGGPEAVASLGRRPILAAAALWIGAAPFALAAPTPAAEPPALHLGARHLSAQLRGEAAVHLRWQGGEVHRLSEARPVTGWPAPVPVPEPPDRPWRGARLLALGLLLLGLHRAAVAPGPLVGLAAGLFTFAAGEVMPRWLP